MSLGKKKAVQAQSPFTKIRDYTVDFGELGSARTGVENRGVITHYTPSANLKGIQDNALSGIKENQLFLNQAPDQQYLNLLRGANPYYNLSRLQLDAELQSQLDQAQQRFSRKGLENSTTMGAYQAQLSSQATLRDLVNQTSSLDYLNNRALTNAQFNQGMLQDISDFSQIPTALSNSNFMAGMVDRSVVNRFNTDQQNQYQQARMRELSDIWQTAITTTGNVISSFASPKKSTPSLGG